ncbi:subtilisin-like protease SBT4.14 isoform X2 [Arachis duranensis]|uniref:Subtilisin-like protease SBT4.14 isoform X2 n=1 Tax=Arachis duranensis TaxID=130453 RepID=A0A6P4D9W2_ARADU|nr:subtilisin-like protease SBT4.14 isoform X2 [Arachis duranensis]
MILQKHTRSFNLLWRLQLVLILLSSTLANGVERKDFYIVFLGAHHTLNSDIIHETHLNVLSSVKGSYLEAQESMVYSYTNSFNAFAAKLSENEAKKLSEMDEVLLVFRNQYRKLHTTRSWNFIGLPVTAKRRLQFESDIVVGVLDTGITPESQSFKDDGLSPPPAKWKGSCGPFANFSGCNNKIIGAKYFKADGNSDPSDILSPIDVLGHGTHTASTAAGTLVPKASLFGLANGTARGAVPSARLAIYKVCWTSSGCADMDILAAFDAAIHDGVDIISISIGGGDPSYVVDVISIGSFFAVSKGILTVASAGNDGPDMATVTNTAPWIVTVAASGIDRAFRSTVILGSGKNVSGIGVSSFNPKQKQYPLINGVNAALNSEAKEYARYCFGGSLDPNKVKGKLVYCKLGTYGTEAIVKEIGGIGAIIERQRYLDVAQVFMAPATIVNMSLGHTITSYIHSTRSPSAVIYKTHEIRKPAPFAASFSSRGPNPGSQNILKPDIAAPGINILASYTLRRSITGLKGDTQFSKFNLLSGTSMACPHVAGVAAYVKSFHPDWTPAAIRSAIITTAKPMSKKMNNEAEFAYGSGQLSPTRALTPGLIYDMDHFGYIQFLCHEGYSGATLSVLLGSPVNCSSYLLPGAIGHDAINYPTMQLILKSNKDTTIGVFKRTVTNVGLGPTIYNATIKSPKGVEITVKPTSLIFSHTMQKKNFILMVKAKSMASMKIISGSLIWRNSVYYVRSPIVIYSP